MTFNQIIIFGTAVQGSRESNSYMKIPWVKEQFISKLGFTPYPGTFNLEIKDRSSLKRWQEIKKREGIKIMPQESGFCSASSYSVLVADKIEGAVVVPEVPGYPDSKVEIIAPCNIRDELGVTDGDLVKVGIVFEKGRR